MENRTISETERKDPYADRRQPDAPEQSVQDLSPSDSRGGRDDGSLNDIPDPDYCFIPAAERLRLILMFLLCIDLFGFPTVLGKYIQAVCGFVPITFYILSGFLVLWESRNRSERILRTVRRSAIVFALMAVIYFAINLVCYCLQGRNILSVIGSKRFWFDFIVLNVWGLDIGNIIWYVQALLYAYIIIRFLDKWGLLRFDWVIALVLLLVTVVTGEFSGIFEWNAAGYTYLPGNFLTRALPYILIGGFIRRKMYRLVEVRRFWFYLTALSGVILIFLEVNLLEHFHVPGYYAHLIGMGVIAVSICILTFSLQDSHGFEIFIGMARWHVNCICYLCQPVNAALVYLLSRMGKNYPAYAAGYLGITTFILCFAAAWLISRIERQIIRKKYEH